ncbi:MAG: hypothetical protein CMH55_00995 [Myxococcales bacterium]|nr:hypothetical protein [Myxococcales bacterium]
MRSFSVLVLICAAGCLPDDASSSSSGGVRGASGGQDAGPTSGASDAGSSSRVDAGGGAQGPDAGGTQPSSPLVDSDCLDGQYRETMVDPDAEIADLVGNFSSPDFMIYIEEVLNRRYPLGWHIIDRGLREGAAIGHCIDFFMRDRSSAERVNSQLSTAVHECGHFLNMSLNDDAFVIRRDLQITCQDGDSTDRFGRTFARSRINDDDYSRLRPPCQGNRSPDCDSYADIYLDGDPDNDDFEGGDQGFNMLAEEVVQYINSLATSYAIYDQSRYSTSARDGILTHLWWIQRYLAHARDRYPAAHQFILGNDCYRRLILTIWGRAWLYLEATEEISQLTINGGEIETLVLDPNLLAEIEAVREAHGCR